MVAALPAASGASAVQDLLHAVEQIVSDQRFVTTAVGLSFVGDQPDVVGIT